MNDDEPQGERGFVSLQGDLRREVALAALLPDNNPGVDELLIAASHVERIDAVAGSAFRLVIERHLANQSDRRVAVWAPRQALPRDQLVDMLTPLPDGVHIDDASDLEGRTRHVLVPATLVTDESAATAAASYALEACDAARISTIRANLVAAAVAELSANTLQHAQGTVLPPAITVTVFGRERTIEVAVVDLGTGISETQSPVDVLAAIPNPMRGAGFLANLIRKGSMRDLAIHVDMLSGVGRLQWDRHQHRTAASQYVPGTTVIVRIPTSREPNATS